MHLHMKLKKLQVGSGERHRGSDRLVRSWKRNEQRRSNATIEFSWRRCRRLCEQRVGLIIAMIIKGKGRRKKPKVKGFIDMFV